MRHLFSRAALAAALTLALTAPAAAQTDILLRVQSGSPAGDRLRVDSAGGLVAMGSLGIGLIPQSGAGERMMWHPYRSAFRAGSVSSTGSNLWDDGNIGFYSTAFGLNAAAQDIYAFAVGGWVNADGDASIAMGHRSTADADYAIAIGRAASANGHIGAIVITDGSNSDSLEASADNQFNLRAAGGIRLYTNATETSGVTMNAGGNTWNTVSDRSRKEHFLAVDGEDILARIRSLPVTTWRYTSEEDRTVRHIGPMAQDWHRAFGFSGDDRTINMGDFDGVNLAAVQALTTRTDALRAENTALRQENAAQAAEIADLRARMERLETLVTGQGSAPRP
jgi:trimeric autotransporter adhesin